MIKQHFNNNYGEFLVQEIGRNLELKVIKLDQEEINNTLLQKNEYYIENDFFDDLVGNGWMYTTADQLGALSEAPCLLYDVDYSDHGDIDLNKDSKGWYYDDYQINSFVNILFKRGKVIFKDLNLKMTESRSKRFRGKKAESNIKKWKPLFEGADLKSIELPGSNLNIVGIGKDVNGNRIISLSFPNSRAFSIQTNQGERLSETHRLLLLSRNMKDLKNFINKDPNLLTLISKELIRYVSTSNKANQLRIY